MAEKNVKKEDVSLTNTSVNSVNRLKTTKSKTEEASKYTIDELVVAEKELGANRVIIRTALRNHEGNLLTLEEAKKFVKEFKNKEVK